VEVRIPIGQKLNYRLSHVEIVTLDGLLEAITFWSSSDGFFRD
jgi:hypothetical protein